jgi:hypothetical protein
VIGGAYPYMDLNAKYEKLTTMFSSSLTTIDPNKDISKTRQASEREIATCKQNFGQKEDFMHSNFQMDISKCSVYLTPQGLPKYIYLSPPLIFPTTYNGIRTKNRPV